MNGNIQLQEKSKSTEGDEGTKTKQTADDVDETIKEEEKKNLIDSNVLQYNVPSFSEKQIVGRSM